MSLLTTLLYPKRTATPPPKAVRRICMERVVVHDGTPATAAQGNKQGCRPAAMTKVRMVLEQQTKPVTLMQLTKLAGVSRATAARALEKYGEIAGSELVANPQGVRQTTTYRSKMK